jgi:hypothetical protein
MQHRKGGTQAGGFAAGNGRRFACLYPPQSDTAQLLQRCPVMTMDGAVIGEVDHLMVDAASQQMRYVVLRDASGGKAVTIPWHLLYFDAALARLVFHDGDS